MTSEGTPLPSVSATRVGVGTSQDALRAAILRLRIARELLEECGLSCRDPSVAMGIHDRAARWASAIGDLEDRAFARARLDLVVETGGGLVRRFVRAVSGLRLACSNEQDPSVLATSVEGSMRSIHELAERLIESWPTTSPATSPATSPSIAS